jgi:hypothetical protein
MLLWVISCCKKSGKVNYISPVAYVCARTYLHKLTGTGQVCLGGGLNTQGRRYLNKCTQFPNKLRIRGKMRKAGTLVGGGGWGQCYGHMSLDDAVMWHFSLITICPVPKNCPCNIKIAGPAQPESFIAILIWIQVHCTCMQCVFNQDIAWGGVYIICCRHR